MYSHVFFEVSEWERPHILQAFPKAQLVDGPLTAENASHYPHATHISTFIYSDVTEEVIAHLKAAKIITTRSTGYDHIDVGACAKRDILVCNVPEYGTHTVAEHTFALILTLSRRMHAAIEQAKKFDFDHDDIRGFDLFGKTIAIIGLGKIGSEVARIAHGFGMKIVTSSSMRNEAFSASLNIKHTSFDDALKAADIVTLHVPYSEKTHHLINAKSCATMKKGAFLINTARGGIVDTQALFHAIESNHLGGAGLDVFEQEEQLMEELSVLSGLRPSGYDYKTLLLDHLLVRHPNVIVTPHNAFNSNEALKNIIDVTSENLHAFDAGEPINTISR